MNMNTLRRAIMGVALAGGAVALVVSPVFAAGPTPPGPPTCGSVASLMNLQIASDVTGIGGNNYISIPGVSPINNNPTSSGPDNGFKQLCAAFGLTTGATAVQQFNGQAGQVETYNCNQPVAPEWTPGQGAFLLSTEFAGTRSGRIPGVECARPYSAFADGPGAAGDHIFPIPLTIAGSNLQDVCDQLNLRPIEGHCNGANCDAGLLGNACTLDTQCNTQGDAVQYADAVAGAGNDFICGQAGAPGLVLGRGLLIRPTTQGVCDLFTPTNLCVRGKVGQACAAHSDCNASPAAGLIPGDTTSTGTATIY